MAREELGLGEYADAVDENRIDADVLRELNEDDLRDLGLPLGDRKRLLRAIREIDEEAGHGAGAAPQPPAEPERRHMTVMFCDLVASTALSVRLDPREVIALFQTCFERVIRCYGGHVAAYLGDGMLVYFGYPRAHEHDPERAVRTGLEVAASVRALAVRPDVRLQCRIGIATGRVVIGDSVGPDGVRKHAVVGETPNLASRLQALASPDGVAVSERTRRLVRLERQSRRGAAGDRGRRGGAGEDLRRLCRRRDSPDQGGSSWPGPARSGASTCAASSARPQRPRSARPRPWGRRARTSRAALEEGRLLAG